MSFISCSSLLKHQSPACIVRPYFISSVQQFLFVLTSSTVSSISCSSLLLHQCPACDIRPYFNISVQIFLLILTCPSLFTISVQHVLFDLTSSVGSSMFFSSLRHQQCPARLLRPYFSISIQIVFFVRPYFINSVQYFLFVLTAPSVSSM